MVKWAVAALCLLLAGCTTAPDAELSSESDDARVPTAPVVRSAWSNTTGTVTSVTTPVVGVLPLMMVGVEERPTFSVPDDSVELTLDITAVGPVGFNEFIITFYPDAGTCGECEQEFVSEGGALHLVIANPPAGQWSATIWPSMPGAAQLDYSLVSMSKYLEG